MKTALINGSSKGRKSTSEWILNLIQKKMNTENVTRFYISGATDERTIQNILEYDILIFVFPNYYGAIPAHVLENMRLLETNAKENQKEKVVYTVINCGFFYSSENHVAQEIMFNWCKKIGFIWGKGLSIGCGCACTVVDDIPLVRIVLKPIRDKIKQLSQLALQTSSKADAGNINRYEREDWEANAWMPCRFYVWIAERIWCAKARKNGLKPREM